MSKCDKKMKSERNHRFNFLMTAMLKLVFKAWPTLHSHYILQPGTAFQQTCGQRTAPQITSRTLKLFYSSNFMTWQITIGFCHFCTLFYRILVIRLVSCCWTCIVKYNNNNTHPFNGPLSGTTQVSRYQGKTNLDFTGARDSEWQWHQLGHTQICTLLQTY